MHGSVKCLVALYSSVSTCITLSRIFISGKSHPPCLSFLLSSDIGESSDRPLISHHRLSSRIKMQRNKWFELIASTTQPDCLAYTSTRAYISCCRKCVRFRNAHIQTRIYTCKHICNNIFPQYDTLNRTLTHVLKCPKRNCVYFVFVAVCCSILYVLVLTLYSYSLIHGRRKRYNTTNDNNDNDDGLQMPTNDSHLLFERIYL